MALQTIHFGFLALMVDSFALGGKYSNFYACFFWGGWNECNVTGSNQLEGTIPAELHRLSKLETIDLGTYVRVVCLWYVNNSSSLW